MFDDFPLSMNPVGVAWRAGKLGWRKRRFLGLWLAGLHIGKETLYVSCAELIRVQRRAKYLLVPSSRMPQMQPPGGVVQMHSAGQSFLRKIGGRPASVYEITGKDENDLRVHVPGRHLLRFLDWYVSGDGRETSTAYREFHEELLELGILPARLFENPRLQRAHTVLTGPRPSKHFGGRELLIHEVFDMVDVTAEQDAHLEKLQDAKHCGRRVGPKAKFGWYTADEISAGGHFPGARKQHWKIGEHAGWMI